MATVIELGAVEGFILDDPVAGVLDNTVYTLGGTVFKDITSRVISATTSRGKNRDLDRFSSGTLNITASNEDRAFDPNYASSPYAGAIVPRREVRVTVDGVRVISTTIDDWNYGYSPDGSSRAEIVATDEFTLLARQVLTAGTATPQLSGARVSAVLDMLSVAWPADRRSIDTGESTLGADVFEGNALQYLQKISDSEQGLLFIAKNGDLVFRDRLDATPTTASLTDFADDGTGIPFTLTAVNYGSELLYNQAVVTSGELSAQADNDRSQVAYGVTSVELDTLVSTSAQLQNLADFLVQKYGDPEYRFETISVNLDTVGATYKATCLGLEIGDVVSITFTPNGIGAPIQQYGQIIRISHELEPLRHDMFISVSSLDWTFLVLDDAVFGKLDSNNALAF
tara:strand:+ start:122 stop:1315 length:1194 start_codon:yes stop_codon:yes gene_type:complete